MLWKIMKKFFLIFIPIILILTYIFYQNNLLPHPKYTNDDFGIQTYKSINDQDHDGISIQVTKKNLILQVGQSNGFADATGYAILKYTKSK